MRTHTITAPLGRVHPTRFFAKSKYSHRIFEMYDDDQLLHFKLKSFGTSGNVMWIEKFTKGDVIKVEYQIECTSKKGSLFTDLIVKSIQLVDPVGTNLEKELNEEIRKMRNRR